MRVHCCSLVCVAHCSTEGAGRPPALARQSSGAPQLPAARVAAREVSNTSRDLYAVALIALPSQTGRRASDGAVLTSSLRKALPVPPADATPDQQQPQQRGLVAPRPVSAALAGNDKDALWEALLHRVGSATPQSNSASPRTNGTSSPLTTSGGGGSGPAYHVGDVVWSRSPDGQWLRGEIVGQVDRGEREIFCVGLVLRAALTGRRLGSCCGARRCGHARDARRERCDARARSVLSRVLT